MIKLKFSPSFIKRSNFNEFSVQFLGKIKLISTFLVEKVKLTHHPQIAGSRSIVREGINNLLRILDSFFSMLIQKQISGAGVFLLNCSRRALTVCFLLSVQNLLLI